MQNTKLKLNEIIWEITDQCHNNCAYCGSKDDLNKTKINPNKIIEIAKKIADYPPNEVNISGGDPLLIDILTTKIVTDILKIAGCRVKIIINPQSICPDNIKKLDFYDWIGLSVNTNVELGLTESYFASPIKENITIITNFSTSNVFLYDEIEKFVREHDLIWQVQYTMGTKDSIYDCDSAKEYLFGKITKSFETGVRLSIADNMNTGSCSAGSGSLGILACGSVVPCLSMRSWASDLNVQGSLVNVQGSLGERSLQDIWEGEFKVYRFCEFKCCKDVCNAPYIQKAVEIAPSPVRLTPSPIFPDHNGASVMAYAVTSPGMTNPPWSNPFKDGLLDNITMVYGVQGGSISYNWETE
jgi:MoaA/NifB/PqqE/SkfB family radical SAM enzyme